MASEEPVHPAGRIPTSPSRDESKPLSRTQLKAQGFTFDVAFTSALTRAQNTLDIILREMGTERRSEPKNWRSTSRQRRSLRPQQDEARKKWGDERSTTAALLRVPARPREPEDTLARALPYFVQEILPCVLPVNARWSRRTVIRCARSSWCWRS